MNSIPFSCLRKHHCAFVDLNSVYFLCTPDAMRLLYSKEPRKLRDEYVQKHRSAGPAQARIDSVLDILARLVVYEFVAIDHFALCLPPTDGLFPSYKRLATHPLSQLIRPTCVSQQAYDAAANAISGLGDLLHPQEKGKPRRQWLRDRDNEWWDADEKFYLDCIKIWASGSRWVKRSNNSAARVLFYLELARIGGCPVFLSPEKRRFFRFVGEEVVPEVYALLERTVEGRMRGTVSELVQQVYGFRREFPVPPLPEYLLSVAERKSVSLLDAFWEIRNGQNAGTFRTWLDGAQRLARENTRPSALALEKHLNEADRLARRWARELDVGLGVKHEVHRANLEAAPGIGWLAKLLGVGRVDYRSRLLRPKLEHMAFVADWYSDPDRG